VPNQGRDIAPFLTAFGQALCDGYAVIGHVHTKQSLHVTDRAAVERWRLFLLENTLGGSHAGAMMDTILAAMEGDPKLGIIFPDAPNPPGWDYNLGGAQALAKRMGITSLPVDFNFPAGTMFWMRSEALRPFVDLQLG